MFRLPQYKLLLEDYLKHLDPDSPDFDDTTQALNIVSEAAEHANNTVKQGVSYLFIYILCILCNYLTLFVVSLLSPLLCWHVELTLWCIGNNSLLLVI